MEEQVNMIDWRGQARALKTTGMGRKRFVIKWGNDWLATGKI